jgi:hypothetical protein
MSEQKETSVDNLFTKTIVNAWTAQISRVSEFVDSIGADLGKEIAPGKNTGIYIFGHLIAVHDAMLPLLGFGHKLYPQLEKIFITSPDKSGADYPSIEELKKSWNAVNDELLKHYNAMSPEEWISRHTAVSETDFAKQPHRNKLNVIVGRTTHIAYHLGQLIFLKKK